MPGVLARIRKILGDVCSRPKLSHRIAPEDPDEGAGWVGQEVARRPSATPRTVGQMRVACRSRQERTNEMGIPPVLQWKEGWELKGS